MKITSHDTARMLVGLVLVGLVATTLYGISKNFSGAKLTEALNTISHEMFPIPREPADDDWRIVG